MEKSSTPSEGTRFDRAFSLNQYNEVPFGNIQPHIREYIAQRTAKARQSERRKIQKDIKSVQMKKIKKIDKESWRNADVYVKLDLLEEKISNIIDKLNEWRIDERKNR